MNLKQAQMLEILSRTHSVSEAAAELGTSQPRLTQQLKAVEAELGVDLFLRSPRGLVLSDAGRTFLPFANQLTSTYQRAQEALSTLSDGRAKHLRLGASITASHQHAPENLLLFHKRHPEVLVTVTRTVPKELMKGLEEGRLDLCLGLDLPESSLFQRDEIFRTELVGLSSATNKPLARTSIADFCRSPLILAPRSCDTRIVLDDALRRAQVKPNIVLEADDVTIILPMVRAGVANTILPRTLTLNSKALLITEFRDFTVEARGTLLYPRSCTHEAQRFIQIIKERLAARRER